MPGGRLARWIGLLAAALVRVGLAALRRADAHIVALDVGRRTPLLVTVQSSRCPSIQSANSSRNTASSMDSWARSDLRGADEARNNHGQSGGRVAGIFFPTLLMGDGRLLYEKADGSLDKGNDVQLAEAVRLSRDARRG